MAMVLVHQIRLLRQLPEALVPDEACLHQPASRRRATRCLLTSPVLSRRSRGEQGPVPVLPTPKGTGPPTARALANEPRNFDTRVSAGVVAGYVDGASGQPPRLFTTRPHRPLHAGEVAPHCPCESELRASRPSRRLTWLLRELAWPADFHASSRSDSPAGGKGPACNRCPAKTIHPEGR
jgi:hypothetical protein